MKYRFFVVLSSFFIFISELVSQPIPIDKKDVLPSFEEVWTKEFNQSLSSIETIIQTKDGYIWIATNNGLFRYDGARFTIFTTQTTSIIKSNVINDLAEDSDGTLWIGTNKGLCSYKNGLFFPQTHDNRLVNLAISSLAIDKNDILYIGTFRTGIYRLSKDRQISSIHGLEKQSIDPLYYKDGILWIGTTTKGIAKFENGKLDFLSGKYPLLANGFKTIFKDSKGVIWFGSTEKGIVKLNGDKIETLSRKNGLTTDRILTINEDKEGSIWIGTAGGGLVRISKNKFAVYTTKDGLNLDAIKSLLLDKENTLWIGTAGGGLNKMKRSDILTYTMRNGLNDNYVWSICQDKFSNIWLSTGSNGINIITKNGVKSLTDCSGIKCNNVRILTCDSKNRIWMGTTDNGITLVDGNKKTSFTKNNGLTDNHIRSIFEDSRGRVWIGSSNYLVFYENGKLQKLFLNGQKRLSGIRYIAEDQHKNLYFASGRGGIFILSGGQLTNYTTNDGLPNNDVLSILCDKNDVTWIATGSGLCRLKDKKIKKINFGNFFDNQLLLHIIKDDYNHLWMSSFVGLLAANIDDMNSYAEGKTNYVRCKIVGKEDGMLSTECNGANQNAGGKTKDGRIWFPTMNGYVTVDPEIIFNVKNSNPPDIMIDRFVVDDSLINFRDSIIEISPGSYKFEFHYAALSYKNPNLNKYKYKLDGFDESWIDAGNRTVAYYTNLSHGTYTLHIIAANSDGVWNTTGKTLTFRILPRFYETGWFVSLVSLFLISATFGIYRWRIRNLRNTKIRLQQIVAEQTCQLQEELHERKQNEIKLKKSEEKLNFYIEGSKDGFWNWNILQDEISYNYNAVKIFSCDFEELPKSRIEYEQRIHPEDLHKFQTALNSYLASGTSNFEIEYRIQCLNTYKWIFDRGKIVEHEDNGNPILMAGSLTDITERKKNEEELLKSKKIESIGILAGGIAHDFNNLLTAILGNISLIRIKFQKNDTNNLLKLLENSEAASIRAKDLTHQLLTFSKGGQPIIKSIAIEKVIQECALFALHGSKIKSHFEFQPDLWHVDADEGQISQVIQNLILNAIQAMPKGGNIFISTKNIESSTPQPCFDKIPNGDYIEISIKDTGSGISKENIEKIFDPYFTTKKTGHGLGLSTSYSIVKKHNGFIIVESEIKKGTTFNIYLPKSVCNNPLNHSSINEIKYGKGKILVMDDEPLIRNLLEEILGNLGYEVHSAKDGNEAIELFNKAMNQKPFEVVILDLTIPGGMGGLETLKNLSMLDPQIKSIVTSGYSNDPIMSDYSTHGFDGVITKPYKIEEISKVIFCVLRKQ